MKPTKNKVFCMGCQRTKMLFESQKKADTYIVFNSSEILKENDKAPVRSYYCSMCGGWHVTSNPSVEAGAYLDSKDAVRLKSLARSTKKPLVMKAEVKNNEAVVKLQNMVSGLFNEFYVKLGLCDFDNAEAKLDVADYEVINGDRNGVGQEIVSRLNARIAKERERLAKCKILYAMTEEEQDEWVEKIDDDEVKNSMSYDVKAIRLIRPVLDLLEKREDIICEEELNVVEFASKWRKYIDSIRLGAGAKKIRKTLNIQLNELLKERKKRMAELYPLLESPNIDDLFAELYPDVQEQVEDTKLLEEYKANILDLIDKLEQIAAFYETEEYDKCEDLLDICDLVIENVRKPDDNINLIKRQICNWRSKLEEKRD